MNVYDFDGTIYDGDSSRDFFFFCLKRHPFIAWRMPTQVIGIVLYALKIIDKTRGKELFFSFLKSIDDIDILIEDFWTLHKQRIMPWYLKQARADDLVISASPEFLLKPICKKMGIDCITSVVDSRTGKFTGTNCYGEEKARRYQKEHPNKPIENFYSDSISDFPIARLSNSSYLVMGDTIHTFPISK